MKFTFNAAGGAATADPRAAPGDVSRAHVATFNDALFNTSTSARRSLLALEGTAANTATVQIWILDDAGFGNTEITSENIASLQWYTLGAPVVLLVGDTVPGPPIPEGFSYIQVTSASAAPSVIKIGNAP